MSTIDFYNLPKKEKAAIFNQVSTTSGIPPYAIEKDWWVVQTLSIIFDMDVSKYFVFKGGTSLSKGWGLIERFSEDIDLAIDRRLFGFEGSVNRSQLAKLRKEAGRFVDDFFLSELRKGIHENGLEDVSIELEPGARSDRDRSIFLHYPFVIESPGYLLPRVKIEFSCRSLIEPFTRRTFGSLVDHVYSEMNFSSAPITVPTVNPERTFLEKLFLLHEEFQRPVDNIRTGDRLSRHLYDVVKISKTPFSDKALASPELYRMVVAHRRQFNAIPGIDYSFHEPATINPIPNSSVISAWRADYAKMRDEMIYEETAPSFTKLLEELIDLKQRLNNIQWTLS